MESTRPIRALIRGLDALTVLNVRGGATVSEVAQGIRLPRTTTYRILETLSHAGYVHRDPDDRYRVTIAVRTLSDGFDDEAWVTHIARPYLYELAREIAWPAAIHSLAGSSMIVRETADRRSPLIVERYPAGTRVPVLTSAAGRAYLAFCDPAQRDSLLAVLAQSSREEDRLAKNRVEVQKLINEARAQGYVSVAGSRRTADEMSIAVPITADDRVLAALSARFSRSAVPPKVVLERLLPKLREAAQRIALKFGEQQREPSLAQRPPALARSVGSRE